LIFFIQTNPFCAEDANKCAETCIDKYVLVEMEAPKTDEKPTNENSY